MTPDGRFIAFAEATITRSTNSVWLWDAQTQTATLVSVNLLGQPSTNGVADSPSLSSDGRYVAFLSSGTDLVTNEVSGDLQVYVRDMQAGVTKLVSADANGRGVGSVDTAPIISANGNAVVFDSRSEGFVPDDLNNAYDVFASDTISGQIELISPGNSTAVGTTANGLSSVGANSISADGRYVVFESVATDLTPGVTNIVFNVFMRDLLAGTNQ
jgi:Tol biopolymer transport system component